MTCYNMTETGLLALVSLLAGTALKCLHDLLQSCRDSRCKKIKVCCLTCDNEILTGQELRELQDVPANTDRDENSQRGASRMAMVNTCSTSRRLNLSHQVLGGSDAKSMS